MFFSGRHKIRIRFLPEIERGPAAIHSFYTPSSLHTARGKISPLSESRSKSGRGRSALNGDMKNDFMQMSLLHSSSSLSLSLLPPQSVPFQLPSRKSAHSPSFLPSSLPSFDRWPPTDRPTDRPTDYIVIFFIAFLSGCVRLEYWHLSCAVRCGAAAATQVTLTLLKP